MSTNWSKSRFSLCAAAQDRDDGSHRTEGKAIDERLEALTQEAQRLVAEIAAARQAFGTGRRPDPAIFARLSRCYDRLDDIADRIGLKAVTQIAAEAGIGLRR